MMSYWCPFVLIDINRSWSRSRSRFILEGSEPEPEGGSATLLSARLLPVFHTSCPLQILICRIFTVSDTLYINRTFDDSSVPNSYLSIIPPTVLFWRNTCYCLFLSPLPVQNMRHIGLFKVLGCCWTSCRPCCWTPCRPCWCWTPCRPCCCWTPCRPCCCWTPCRPCWCCRTLSWWKLWRRSSTTSSSSTQRRTSCVSRSGIVLQQSFNHVHSSNRSIMYTFAIVQSCTL